MASTSSLPFRMTTQLPSTSYIPTHRTFHMPAISVNLRLLSSRCSVITCARRRSSKSSSSVPSSKKKKLGRNSVGKDEDMEEDAFEALFKQLEEDLKNDGLSFDDDDDEISEEDLIKLERELEEALADDELLGLFDDSVEEENEVKVKIKVKDKKVVNKKDTIVNEVIEIESNNLKEDEDEDEDGNEDEDEGPLELKRWQMRRLAYALKEGRRKTNIKNLAADLCLDRAVVLELLRDPPPDLLMLSASLPDKPDSMVLEPIINPEDALLLESEKNEINAKITSKVPVHEMQSNWSAQKRLKKVHLETLERVYRRSKRPTNAMISNIVHVTNIPRKRVLKWFEDKRGEDGVPDRRLPYQRDTDAENEPDISYGDSTEGKKTSGRRSREAIARLAMATLQRANKSFRRQGSSGSVWDGKNLAEEANQLTGEEDQRQLRPCYSVGGGVRKGSISNINGPVVYTRSLSTPIDGGRKHDK